MSGVCTQTWTDISGIWCASTEAVMPPWSDYILCVCVPVCALLCSLQLWPCAHPLCLCTAETQQCAVHLRGALVVLAGSCAATTTPGCEAVWLSLSCQCRPSPQVTCHCGANLCGRVAAPPVVWCCSASGSTSVSSSGFVVGLSSASGGGRLSGKYVQSAYMCVCGGPCRLHPCRTPLLCSGSVPSIGAAPGLFGLAKWLIA
jgi:hypothetical protein